MRRSWDTLLQNYLRPTITREAYAAQYHLDLNKCWITIMPGSREKEVRMNLPTMLDAAALLGAGFEFLLPVAPTLDRDLLEESTRGRGITLGRRGAARASSRPRGDCRERHRDR